MSPPNSDALLEYIDAAPATATAGSDAVSVGASAMLLPESLASHAVIVEMKGAVVPSRVSKAATRQNQMRVRFART